MLALTKPQLRNSAGMLRPPGIAMKLPYFACSCNIKHLESVPGQAWLRLLPRVQMYRCMNCGQSQVFSRRSIDRALALQDAQPVSSRELDGMRHRPPH
ncbi:MULTISPECIES: hypothetical protein [unclassified Variovorax]|uniref:hypothetical protein n=1 Tax=unclassified Variovorax TaxID=663243 RepID=UPI0034E936F0